MSLLELLTALAILSLAAALLFSNLGPGLQRTRASADEASFWRSISATELLLSELTAGGVDPGTWVITSREARFQTLTPRLAPTPVAVRLFIQGAEDHATLMAEIEGVGQSTVLEAPGPIRFDASRRRALVVELNRNGAWSPIVSASFAADAPLVCAFDPIPRTCRS